MVAYDTSVAMSFGSGTSATLGYTTGTGSNFSLFCVLDTEIANATAITGVTWNSSPMVLITSIASGAGGAGIDVGWVFGISGANVTANQTANLVVSASASVGSIGVAAVSYTGTDQSNTFNGNSSNGTGTSASTSVTVIGANSWVGGFAENQGSGTLTLTSAGTARQTGSRPISDTNGIVSSGSNTVSYSESSLMWSAHAWEIAAFAVASAQPTSTLLYMGV